MGFEVPLAQAGWRGRLRPECFEFRSSLADILNNATDLVAIGAQTSVWSERVVVHSLSARAALRGHQALHAVRVLGPQWPRPYGFMVRGGEGRLFVEYVRAPLVVAQDWSLGERRAFLRALGAACRPLWQHGWVHGALDPAHVAWDDGPVFLSPQHLRRARVWTPGPGWAAFCRVRTDRARFLEALVRHAPDRGNVARRLWRQWAAIAPVPAHV